MKIPNYDTDFPPRATTFRASPACPPMFSGCYFAAPAIRAKQSFYCTCFTSCWRSTKFSFFPKTCTRTNTRLFCETLPKTSTPMLGTRSLRLPAMKSSLSKSFRWTTKKSLSLREGNQNRIINYFIHGRHRNCSVVYLTQTFHKVPKNIRDNCSHFRIFRFLPREKKLIADEIGVDHDLLDRATDKKFSFLYYDKPRKSVKKNFDEDI